MISPYPIWLNIVIEVKYERESEKGNATPLDFDSHRIGTMVWGRDYTGTDRGVATGMLFGRAAANISVHSGADNRNYDRRGVT